MARPRKTGLDYFPIDCDILNDEKIIAVSVNCGARGIAVTFALLCAIYRNGYYALWNDATENKIAAALPGVNPDAVKKVIEILVKYDFFDKGLSSTEKVLTSAAIQRRYFSAKRMTSPPPDLPYILVSATKTQVIAAKTPVSATKTPIKEKEITSTTTTTPKPPNPVEPPPEPSSCSPIASPGPPDGPPLDPDIAGIYADDAWLDMLQVSTATPKSRLRELLRDFDTHCRLNCKLPLDSPADARRYFRYWLNYQLKNPSQNAPTSNTDRPAAAGRQGPQASRRRPSLGFGLHKD